MMPSGSLTRQTVENGKVILKMQSNSELDFRPAKAHTRTQTQHTHTLARTCGGWAGGMVLGFKPLVYVRQVAPSLSHVPSPSLEG